MEDDLSKADWIYDPAGNERKLRNLKNYSTTVKALIPLDEIQHSLQLQQPGPIARKMSFHYIQRLPNIFHTLLSLIIQPTLLVNRWQISSTDSQRSL